MSNKEVIERLQSFRHRLLGEVLQAYQKRGSTYGDERFRVWRRKIRRFLDTNLPGESARLDNKLQKYGFVAFHGESDAERFWREDGELAVSFIDSLIVDLEAGDYEAALPPEDTITHTDPVDDRDMNSVFIVHGHDELVKSRTARFVEQLGLTVVILHEQASRGRTVIEKIETYSNVGFAIVLYTPDDIGNSSEDEASGILNSRARQNVVFEHGYLMAKLGRDRVIPVVSGDIELPSDISGVVYISDDDWKLDIAKEMRDAGYEIDFNSIL